MPTKHGERRLAISDPYVGSPYVRGSSAGRSSIQII